MKTLTIPLGFHCSSSRVSCYLRLTRTSILVFNARFIKHIRTITSGLDHRYALICLKTTYPTFTRSLGSLVSRYTNAFPTYALRRASSTTVCFSSNAANFPGTVLRGRRDLVRSYHIRRVRRKRAGSSYFLYVPPLCRAKTGVR